MSKAKRPIHRRRPSNPYTRTYPRPTDWTKLQKQLKKEWAATHLPRPEASCGVKEPE